jgi:hypothetical protein
MTMCEAVERTHFRSTSKSTPCSSPGRGLKSPKPQITQQFTFQVMDPLEYVF